MPKDRSEERQYHQGNLRGDPLSMVAARMPSRGDPRPPAGPRSFMVTAPPCCSSKKLIRGSATTDVAVLGGLSEGGERLLGFCCSK